MSLALTVDDATRLSQRRASDPRASAWVSANAGSGKTKVLTDRVLRLLLEGAPPGRILCLTFTKAAAANMAVKVFDRLGRWVTLDDEALGKELLELEGQAPDARRLAEARRLFARAVETPGGLKIETIHAFCERLLHLAPFEANVPASFAVLEEGEAEMLAQGGLDSVFADAASGRYPALGEALAAVSAEAVGDPLRNALLEAVSKRAFLDHPDGWEAALAQARRPLGLAPGETAAELERQIIEDGLGDHGRREAAEALAASKGKTDQDCAETLLQVNAAPAEDRLDLYLSVFFNKDGEPRARLGTKSVPEAAREALAAERERVARLCAKHKGARAAERTAALFTLAAEIRRRVERTKSERGVLDFDDLIERTKALLRDQGGWILYKLDRGIDHVLVDEAQDTSRAQWEILEALTEEFTAGHGARGHAWRTFFAVGDPKQSIYSFQGADPAEFERSRLEWKRRTKAANLAFADEALSLSFRSTSCVLRAVDDTFSIDAHLKGLAFGDHVRTVHSSARPRAPGAVEIWPTLKRAPEDEDPDAWAEPLDEPEQGSPPVRAAQAVAQAIRHWTREGDEHGRVIPAGEIMVLMRRRGPAFEAVIRALREAGVPVAGQDRLAVHEHIAVLDLVAAGRAALLPEDDLTLAAALKSPLVALDDDDLLRIAADRPEDEPLAWALARRAAEGDGAARRGLDALQAWRLLAREQGPFAFYATLLGPMGGRAKLVGRLGGEAGDAVDVFLCTAHQAEGRAEASSLAGFLARYERQGGREAAGHTVKRDLEGGRDEVRVMTVHGAKGLEAEVVVVIDGCEKLGRDPCLIAVPVTADAEGLSVPLWSPAKAGDCEAVAAARSVLHERAREEHNRLLYVAMTRAKDRLVIAPYLNGDKEEPEQAWCRMVREAFAQRVGAIELESLPYGEAQVVRDGEASAFEPRAAIEPAAADEVPGWLREPAPPEPEPLPPLRPSSALSAADRPMRVPEARYDPDARLAGTLVHTLLERLPLVHPDRRPAVAEAYVRARAPSLPPGRRERIVAQALEVLDDPRLRPLFGPGSRPEAPIVGRLETAQGEVAVSGQIDRLVVGPEEVLVADYKTTLSPPPEDAPAPAPYAAQLALYRTLLQDIYPGRRVRCFLVWTAGARVQELGAAELDAALATIRSA